jgi:hypothetical protein
MVSLADATDYVKLAATGKIVSGSTERRSALRRWAHNDFADIDIATNGVVSQLCGAVLGLVLAKFLLSNNSQHHRRL